ncbi:MAG: ABC transporter substrate-binding protein, partial [Thermoproteota archaeon]
GEAINKALPVVARGFYGLSGWCDLDEAGDRARGDYGVFMIVKKDGAYDWELVGMWSAASDTVAWTIEKPS